MLSEKTFIVKMSFLEIDRCKILLIYVFKTIKKKFSNIKIRGALQFGEKSNESSAYFWYEFAPGAEDVMVKNTIVDEDEIIVPVE